MKLYINIFLISLIIVFPHVLVFPQTKMEVELPSPPPLEITLQISLETPYTNIVIPIPVYADKEQKEKLFDINLNLFISNRYVLTTHTTQTIIKKEEMVETVKEKKPQVVQIQYYEDNMPPSIKLYSFQITNYLTFEIRKTKSVISKEGIQYTSELKFFTNIEPEKVKFYILLGNYSKQDQVVLATNNLVSLLNFYGNKLYENLDYNIYDINGRIEIKWNKEKNTWELLIGPFKGENELVLSKEIKLMERVYNILKPYFSKPVLVIYSYE